MYVSRENVVVSMEEILVFLRNLQEENQIICEFIVHFQKNEILTSLGYIFHNKNKNKIATNQHI
jgi:hypothetical protein